MENNATEELIETIDEEVQSEPVVINEFTCTCQHLDYTEQLEYLISIEEQNLISNQQIVANNLYIIAFFVGFGVSYLLYKLIKLFY